MKPVRTAGFTDPSARTANVVFALFLLGVSALLLVTGPVPQLLFPSDVMNMLDGSYRQYLGQVSHHDFYAPLGGIAFLPYSLSMHLVGPSARALAWGIMLGFLVVSGWAWGLTRGRLSFPERMLFVLFVGLLVAATYPLDFGSWATPSYAMHYNRLGWAGFALVALECFVPPRVATRPGEWAAGICTGALVAGLFFLKVNFFACVAGLVICAPLTGRPHTLARWLAGLAGATGATIAAVLLVHIDLAGYIGEIRGMAGSQPPGIYLDTLARILTDNRWWLVAVSGTSLGLLGFARRADAGRRRQLLRATMAFLLIVGAGLAVSLTNCQYAELPTFPLAFMVLAVLLPGQTAGWMSGILRIAALFAILSSIGPNAGMLARACARQLLGATSATNSLLVKQPALATLALRTWPGEIGGPNATERISPRGDGSPYAYGLWLQDGIDLLAPRITATSRVLNLDWSNPFPFALALPPIPGDQIAWHYGRALSDTHHPDPEMLAAQADFILEPRTGTQPASTAFKRGLFSTLMTKSFVRVASNRSWILWQRLPNLAPSHP